MLIAIIILAWLLASTWVTLVIICVDERYKCHEWAGIVIACLFSPLAVFIVRPIVLAIDKRKQRRKRK